MKEVLIKEYNNLQQLNIPFKKGTNTLKVHFINGAFAEVLGPNAGDYTVNFYDQKTDRLQYQCDITNNMWTKSNIQYFLDWKIQVVNKETGEVELEHKYNAKGKRVYIHLDSSALGDTLAWFPYVDEFRKKHDCHVICSTFHNE